MGWLDSLEIINSQEALQLQAWHNYKVQSILCLYVDDSWKNENFHSFQSGKEIFKLKRSSEKNGFSKTKIVSLFYSATFLNGWAPMIESFSLIWNKKSFFSTKTSSIDKQLEKFNKSLFHSNQLLNEPQELHSLYCSLTIFYRFQVELSKWSWAFAQV